MNNEPNASYGQMNNYGNDSYSSNYGGNYGGNYSNNYSNKQSLDEEGGSDFDVLAWVRRILHYWYLFAIAIVIALCASYLTNRKWLPSYYSSGTIIIKESTGGAQNLMHGFGVDPGYRNVNNQVVMLGSYDLTKRVIDSLPFLNVDYISQGRFKTRNIYTNTPIIVEKDPKAHTLYGPLWRCTFQSDGSLLLESTDEDMPLSVVTHYGERVETPYFTATIWPTEKMINKGVVYFRFRTTDGLVNEFLTRMQLNYVTEGCTVLRISLTSETPERDRDFIDKLSDIYLLQNLERKNLVADNSIKFINEQLELLEKSLEVSETEMTTFRQQNKFVDVGSYAGQLMSKMAAYDQEFMSLRLKETYLDYLTNYLEQSIEQGGIVAPSSLGLNEPMLMSLTQQLNDLQIQRGEVSEKNVYYAKYTNDINNVKSAINEVVKSMRASLEIEKADLNKRSSNVEREIQHLPTKELQMVAIERNYRIDDNYYTFFLQKRAEAEIQKASNTPDNDILDRARTTVVINNKDKRKTTTTYLLISVLIPLLLIILSELTNDKIRTPKEAEKLSHFRMLGTIRHAKIQNPTLVKSNPRSTYAEMLRAIRTRIEFLVQRKDKIVLCITSTESGDGKTFLSSNLASLYALTGKKTLLLDLDIRKPNIHTKLGLEDGLGVTNYLIGDCTLEDLVVRDSLFDFDIIRAGTIPPNPGELIHSDKLAEMISTLRQQYDFIIIDTSPIGLVPDAYSIVEQTDITLYVIRCLQTSKSFCKQTLEQLEIDQENKIHLILSDIPTNGYHGGYHYGYGASSYGYGYGYGYGSKQYGSNSQYSWKYKYSQYYTKLFKKDKTKPETNYYMDEEDV